MSDIIEVGVRVDTRPLNDGTTALRKFGNQAKKTNSASSKLSKGLKIGLVAATAFATAALYKMIKSHIEFTKSMSELSAITGATGNDLKYFREQAMEMGAATTFSASEVATAFKLIASAKPELLASKEALAAVTMETLTLAEASGMQLPEAANALGGALNQFGMGAASASRFINVLAAGSKYGSSEINQTAEAMKNAGSVASSLGLSFETTNAAIQAMAAVSIKGAEAGTGLRGVLLKLATQSNDNFNPEIVGLEKAMLNLRDANLTTTEKSKLFGQESITAATALMNQADALGELTDKLTGTNTATEQAQISTNNLKGDIDRMGSAWSAVGENLITQLSPALRMVIGFMTDMAQHGKAIVIYYNEMTNALSDYAAMAMAVLSLDGDKLQYAIDMRKQGALQTEEKLANLYRVKTEEDKVAAEAVKVAAAKKEQDEKDAADELARDNLLLKEKADKAKKAADEKIELEKVRVEKLEEARLLFVENDQKEHEENLARGMEKFIAQDALEAANNEAAEARKKAHLEKLFGMEVGQMTAISNFTKAIQAGDLKAAIQNGAAAIGNLGKHSRAMFNIKKASAISNILTSTPAAIMETIKAYPFPYNVIPAALVAAQGAAQLSSVMSASFGGGGSAPSVSGGGSSATPSAPVASGIPAGAMVTPDSMEAKQPQRELRVVVEGDGVHSEGMRQFARNLAETIKDMGGTDNLVIS